MASLSITGSLSSIKEPKSNRPIKGPSAWLLARLKEESELRFWPHPFRSVSEMLAHYRLPDNKFNGWRLTVYVLGHIQGLPNLRGRMLATNGLLCLICGEHDKIIIGHVANFVMEDNLEEVEKQPRQKKESQFDSLMKGFKL